MLHGSNPVQLKPVLDLNPPSVIEIENLAIKAKRFEMVKFCRNYRKEKESKQLINLLLNINNVPNYCIFIISSPVVINEFNEYVPPLSAANYEISLDYKLKSKVDFDYNFIATLVDFLDQDDADLRSKQKHIFKHFGIIYNYNFFSIDNILIFGAGDYDLRQMRNNIQLMCGNWK